jgi:two-component sensor histidine kinase/CHASE3 domain sensor protein
MKLPGKSRTSRSRSSSSGGGLLHDIGLWWNSSRNDGFGVLIALGFLLLISMALVWDTVSAERQQRSQAQRTDAIITSLHEILELTTSGETGQRGYFITGDRRYLAPFEEARKGYRPAIDRLRLYTADDPQSASRDAVEQIARLTEAKFQEMDNSVLLISQGATEEARLRILSNKGQETMEQLRAALTTYERVERAAAFDAGQRAASAEARIVPGLVLLLLMVLAVLALGMWQVRRLIDAEVRAANADELERAKDRADLLSRELNHRIKNLFAVVLAIVRMSGKGDAAAKPALERVATRITALLSAHQLTQSGGGSQAADLGQLVETALAPYRSEANPCTIDGPSLPLSDKLALPLGLVLHELATNAVKYGAWSQPGGRLSVEWLIDASDEAVLTWQEHCAFTPQAPAEGDRQGFGTKLAESSARQLQGSIARDFTEKGLVITLRFPLQDDEDAPG